MTARQAYSLFACAALGALFLTGCQPAMRGEPWTIECLALRGRERSRNAETVAEVFRQADGIDGKRVFVRHTDDASTIYYGRYFRRIDRDRGKRDVPRELVNDLNLVREMGDDRGRRIFLAARMIREPMADVGPPDWNLANTDGVYTLQVAAFEPTPEQPNFKRAAVEHARLLRENGYEAYYHHGLATSEVTLGVFGADAVINRDGKIDYSSEVRVLQRKEQFRYNLTNGAIWYAIVDGQKAPVRSLLVRIPQREESRP